MALVSIPIHDTRTGLCVRVIPMRDHYAVTAGNQVVGTVERCNETQWGFYPLGDGSSGSQYVQLHHALEQGRRYAESLQ